MVYDITLIRGDGTGPEIVDATVKCIEATGVKIRWDVAEAGADVKNPGCELCLGVHQGILGDTKFVSQRPTETSKAGWATQILE